MTPASDRLWIAVSLLLIALLFAGIGAGVMRGDWRGFVGAVM